MPATIFGTLNAWVVPVICASPLAAARRREVKKTVPFIVAAALGVGFVSAAQAHVSVGIGIGIPVAPVYPVYAAPVYAPPPAVVYGGYGGYGYYGHPYWRHGGYYRHGYYRR